MKEYGFSDFMREKLKMFNRKARKQYAEMFWDKMYYLTHERFMRTFSKIYVLTVCSIYLIMPEWFHGSYPLLFLVLWIPYGTSLIFMMLFGQISWSKAWNKAWERRWEQNIPKAKIVKKRKHAKGQIVKGLITANINLN